MLSGCVMLRPGEVWNGLARLVRRVMVRTGMVGRGAVGLGTVCQDRFGAVCQGKAR